MLRHTVAHGAVWHRKRVCAEVDSRENNIGRTGDWNRHCAWLSNPTFYQQSHSYLWVLTCHRLVGLFLSKETYRIFNMRRRERHWRVCTFVDQAELKNYNKTIRHCAPCLDRESNPQKLLSLIFTAAHQTSDPPPPPPPPVPPPTFLKICTARPALLLFETFAIY